MVAEDHRRQNYWWKVLPDLPRSTRTNNHSIHRSRRHAHHQTGKLSTGSHFNHHHQVTTQDRAISRPRRRFSKGRLPCSNSKRIHGHLHRANHNTINSHHHSSGNNNNDGHSRRHRIRTSKLNLGQALNNSKPNCLGWYQQAPIRVGFPCNNTMPCNNALLC